MVANQGLFSKKDFSDINYFRVLGAIRISDRISRIELSRALGLDKSTVTKIVNRLLDQGLVEDLGEGEAGRLGGRKPVHLSIRKNAGRVLGIEIQTERIITVATDLSGNIVYHQNKPAAFEGRPIQSVFLDNLNEALSEIETGDAPMLGAGVGLSGIIDPIRGVIKSSLPLGIESQVDFCGSFAKILSFPVRLENDANCGCWAELAGRKNRKRDLGDFLFVLGELRKATAQASEPGGLAVGMGFVIDGTVHYGSSYSAGEFKSVFKGGGRGSQFSVPDELLKKASEDQDAFKVVAEELGRNIALLVNSLNLTNIFIGGSIEKYRNIIIPIFEAEIRKNWAYDIPVDCEIGFSELGDKVVAYGAAGRLLEEFFSVPAIAPLARMKA
jgi:predicted NBD/HSP70 family sugar kinase